MSSSDEIASLGDGPEVEHRVRGSRFLGRAFAAATEVEAERGLAAVRREHHAATHHCWAFRLAGDGSVVERFDDDGEPSGTAGRPILATLRGRGLADVLVAVTRYFGGTKLGTGGLARAYGEASALAIEAAPSRTIVRLAVLRVRCGFEDVGSVEGILSRAGGDVVRIERAFEPHPAMTVTVRRSRAQRLAEAVREGTAGRATVVSDP